MIVVWLLNFEVRTTQNDKMILCWYLKVFLSFLTVLVSNKVKQINKKLWTAHLKIIQASKRFFPDFCV